VDSGSTDGTLEKLKACPYVELYEIPPHEFNHGRTRTLGPSLTDSEFIVYTVQDARAYDSHWLENLMEPILRNSRVQAVCGAQVVPHERDKNPLDWFRPVSEPQLTEFQFRTPSDFDALSPIEKHQVCSWDNVTALYRRSALEAIPFQETSYYEDGMWAMQALRAGLTLAYNPAARVYHYHLENDDFTFARTITVLHHRYQLFGVIPPSPQFIKPTLIGIAHLIRLRDISVFEKIRWIRYHFSRCAALSRGTRAFLSALSQGSETLEELHCRYCKKPPVPVKSPIV
jgi:rhamnosyltransferase